MFKTNNLVGHVCCESNSVVYMNVYTKYDNHYIVQIIVSLIDETPYFDDSWIDKTVETCIVHLSRDEIKLEIEQGVKQFINIRKKLPINI